MSARISPVAQVNFTVSTSNETVSFNLLFRIENENRKARERERERERKREREREGEGGREVKVCLCDCSEGDGGSVVANAGTIVEEQLQLATVPDVGLLHTSS